MIEKRRSDEVDISSSFGGPKRALLSREWLRHAPITSQHVTSSILNATEPDKNQEAARVIRSLDCRISSVEERIEKLSRNSDLIVNELAHASKQNDLILDKLTKVQETITQLAEEGIMAASTQGSITKRKYGPGNYQGRTSTAEKTATLVGKDGIFNEKPWLLTTQTPWRLYLNTLLSVAASKNCFPDTDRKNDERKKLYREASRLVFKNNSREYSRRFTQKRLRDAIPSWRATLKERLFRHIRYITGCDKHQNLTALCNKILADRANTFGYEGQVKRKFKTLYLARALQVAFRMNTRRRRYTSQWGWTAYPAPAIALVMTLLHFCLADPEKDTIVAPLRGREVYDQALTSLEAYNAKHPSQYQDAVEWLWEFGKLEVADDESKDESDEEQHGEEEDEADEGQDGEGLKVDEGDDECMDLDGGGGPSASCGTLSASSSTAQNARACAEGNSNAATSHVGNLGYNDESDDEDDVPLSIRCLKYQQPKSR
ncbi:hypothetical protein SeMB42_g02753 [Synchytrium endobioticum]|uniref:DUF6532 domain-containing protein n=1 Tax=Synchytrium endobioticum TaxID=286115 RepID=A0A507DBJ5_9FUNG|nr:hypothetical protein SeLEV6574_g04515 [Synchytrium endobioticum]TPX49059.1 hypothetical protein SeMB42_g02753 [Synchytrium endobioticum]